MQPNSSQETDEAEAPRLAKQARPCHATRVASNNVESTVAVETESADEIAMAKPARVAARPAKAQQEAKDTVVMAAESRASRIAKQPKANLKTKQSDKYMEGAAAVQGTHARETGAMEVSKVAMQTDADKEADDALAVKTAAAKTAAAKAWLAKQVKAHQEAKVSKCNEAVAVMECTNAEEFEAAKVSKVSRQDASEAAKLSAKAARQAKGHQKPKLAKQAKAHQETTEAKQDEEMTAMETDHARETLASKASEVVTQTTQAQLRATKVQEAKESVTVMQAEDAKDIDARAARRAQLHQELQLSRSSSWSCHPAKHEAAEAASAVAAADKEVPEEDAVLAAAATVEEEVATKAEQEHLAVACKAEEEAKAAEEAAAAAARDAEELATAHQAAEDEAATNTNQAACTARGEAKVAEEDRSAEEATDAAASTETRPAEEGRQAEEGCLAAEEASCMAEEESKKVDANHKVTLKPPRLMMTRYRKKVKARAKSAEEAASAGVTTEAANEADHEDAAGKLEREQLAAEEEKEEDEALRNVEDSRGAEETKAPKEAEGMDIEERLPATPQRRRSSSFPGGKGLSPIPPTSPSSVWRSQTSECCSICCEDAPPGEAVRLSCNHGWYCLSCLKRHAEARLDNGSVEVPCPECNQALADRTLRRVLPSSVLEQLERRSLEQAVSAAGDLYACPTANCPFRVALEEGDVARLKCPECKKTCCLRCGAQPYHRGLSCEAYAEKLRAKGKSTGEEELLKWMEETGSKQCPTCRAVVSKQNLEKQNSQYVECHKMQCRNCDTRFCFKCLAVLTATFSCGCTRAEHGFINPKTGRRMNHLKQKAGKK
eukprot:TRINITY_DN15916_c0_g1_i3.p1 TRINITY_DN15916_c0_g1~~TRINITY_DN15916_c0_g1_i3.p1  ORF type:complete len:834 (+),score=233.02 TRINITY_DN15916_c0_g1_i3:1086-3587(+)